MKKPLIFVTNTKGFLQYSASGTRCTTVRIILNINIAELLDFLRNHFDPNLTLMLKKEVITHHTKWTEELYIPSNTCYSMNFCDIILTSKAHGIQEVSGSIPLISTNGLVMFERKVLNS